MHKGFLAAGALFGGFAVALGAFGAHGLEKITSDDKILHSFQTGVIYQMYHALALLLVGLIFQKLPARTIRWTGYLFIAGVILFSGSLYLLTFLKVQGGNTRWVGPVTPIGGLLIVAGWISLLAGVIKKN